MTATGRNRRFNEAADPSSVRSEYSSMEPEPDQLLFGIDQACTAGWTDGSYQGGISALWLYENGFCFHIDEVQPPVAADSFILKLFRQ